MSSTTLCGRTRRMTGKRVARIALTVLFVALLAAPVVVKRMSAPQTTASSADHRSSALARHGFYLQEVARSTGIDFVHQAPKLDRVLDPIMPEMASLGA